VTAGLLVSSASALAATCYSAISCRFLRIQFTSTSGCFEEAFQPYSTTGNFESEETSSCQAGVGLYQWLQPLPGKEENWSEGTCEGYQQTMLEILNQDPIFQVARGFGVFGVLLSFVIFFWHFFLACVELNRIQVYLLRACSFLAVTACGLTFLLHRSILCNLFDQPSCQIDEGAMAMIAACILWTVDLLISVVWITPENIMMDDSTDREEDDHKQQTRSSRGGDSKRSRSASTKVKARAVDTVANSIFSGKKSQTPDTIRSGEDRDAVAVPRRHKERLMIDDVSTAEQLEVYVSKRLDNIERHMREP
jgi:hypothetical protein